MKGLNVWYDASGGRPGLKGLNAMKRAEEGGVERVKCYDASGGRRGPIPGLPPSALLHMCGLLTVSLVALSSFTHVWPFNCITSGSQLFYTCVAF